MATTAVRTPSHDGERDTAADRSENDDLAALRDENRQLRELVIQLSKLVIRNVLEHK